MDNVDTNLITSFGRKGIICYLIPRTSYTISKYDVLFVEERTHIFLKGRVLDDHLKNMRKDILAAQAQLQSVAFCVSTKDLENCDQVVSEINVLIHRNVRKKKPVQWTSFLAMLDDCILLPSETSSLMKEGEVVFKKVEMLSNKYKTKAEFLKVAMRDEIGYMNAEEFDKGNWSDEGDICLLISERFKGHDVLNNFKFLEELKKTQILTANFHLVDLDVKSTGKEAVYDSSIIIHYSQDACLCPDVVKNLTDSSKNNHVLFHPEAIVKTTEPPIKRTLLHASCPVCPSFQNKWVHWRCIICKTLVEYWYDGRYQCNCGVSSSFISFRCHKYYHRHFTPNNILKTPMSIRQLDNLQPLKEVNLLLIGQSGVGKSTWINGIANYLLFQTLDAAMKGDAIDLVSTQFTLYDAEYKEHKVIVGQDDNEELSVGASATQKSRSYVLYRRGLRINLIDTPGLGDTRGYEQDMSNVQDILQYLKTVPVIHGVCFLLLPNETRANATLRYSIKEIMCYLHRSVLPNLVFIFTNGRSTNYRPGDTFPLLQKILKDARVDFSLSQENIYMYDNEAYRYMCAATRTKMKFTEKDHDMFTESWNISSKETNRFIDHLINCEPYKSKQSVDLGYVRFKLMKVMSEELEASTVQSVDNITAEIKHCEKKLEALEKHLNITKTTIVEEIAHDRVVCGTPSCCTVEGGGIIYKICVNTCNVSKNYRARPNAQLRLVPELANVNCTVCGCRWESHMVLNVNQKLKEIAMPNPDIVAEKSKIQRTIKSWQAKIKEIEKSEIVNNVRCENLRKFSKVLAKYVAQHGLFLSNDAIVDYLDVIIHQLETKSDKIDLDLLRLRDLTASKEKHSELLKILKQLENIEYVATKTTTYLNVAKIDEFESQYDVKSTEEPEENIEKLQPEKRVIV